jgi:hypothetical protein
MFADEMLRATDAQSNIEARLSVVRGTDGGAASVVVDLSNQADDDVVLKVNTALSAFIMLTVADEQGTILSKPARQFTSEEIQQFDFLRIPPGASHQWRVPIANQMDIDAIPDAELNGRLVVNVVVLFSRTTKVESAEDDFQTSILTLYDTNVLFTRASLSEGNWAPTNGQNVAP